MISQVLILRELLVLAQGHELKLALGLWGWLLWVGLGSLAGGACLRPGPLGRAGPAGWVAGAFGAAVACHHPGEPRPPQPGEPPPGPIPALSTTFLLFVLLLAPLGWSPAIFFPKAVQALSAAAPQGRGAACYLETLGAALGVALLQLFLVGRYANLSLGLATGLGLALAPWLLARPRSPAGPGGARP